MFRQGGWWTKQEEAMAQALIYKASHTRPLGKCLRCWPYLCYSRGCIMVAYIWFFMMALGGLTLLFVFGIGTVKPYLFSLQFKVTQCHTVRSWYVQNEDGSLTTRSCSCGKYCTGNWPCLQIAIEYTPVGEEEPRNATMAESQYELTDGHGCSFKPVCQRTGNLGDVETYEKKYGTYMENYTYPCHYNPSDPSMVFRKRRLSDGDMLHLLLWPSVLTLTFIGLLIVVILTCGCEFIWTQRPPAVISDYGCNGDGHYYHHHHKGFRGRCSLCSRNEERRHATGSEAGTVLIQTGSEAAAGYSSSGSKCKTPIPMADM